MKKKKKRKKIREKKEKKVKLKISWSYIFSYGNNLALNSLIAIFLLGLAFLIIFYHCQLSLKQEQLKNTVLVGNEIASDRTKLDISSWKKYQALWYGFELKNPENWEEPIEQNSPTGSDWEYRYSFRKKDPGEMENSCKESAKQLNIDSWQLRYLFYKKNAEENNPYSGFDVIIYDFEKNKGLAKTDEFPTIEKEYLKVVTICDQIEESLLENENYPAEKIHVLSDDDCHNSIFFYSLAREKYLYNLVPVLKENLGMSANAKKEAINNFPEFFSVASSFKPIDIKRPQIIPRKPRITAPKPIANTKTVNGMRSCAKKNDNPSKSNKSKGKHIDMECCLDPDEYPNPWCYYSRDKYGKYL